MKRTLRFLLVLIALMALMTSTQTALVGACSTGFGYHLPCND